MPVSTTAPARNYSLFAPSEVWSRPYRALCFRAQGAADRLDQLDISPRTRLMAQYGATTVAGAAIAGTTGLIAAKAVVPALLHVSQTAGSAFNLFYGMPVIGHMIDYALSRGGVLGAVATSGIWLGVINTLMLSEGGADTATHWAMAHMAIGFAAAPLLLPGVVAGAPVLGAAATAALVTSYTVTGRLLSGKSTWQGAIMGALGALALGPMGAQLAMGVADNAVLGTALMLGAAGAMLMGAYIFSYGWRTLTTDETALLHRSRVDTAGALRLDMPGEAHPGAFGLPEGLVQELKACALNLRERMKLGLRCYLFSGAPGTGKTLIAQGIAKRLEADLFAPRAATIKSQPNPAAYVIELFEEARIKARKTGRPVVLFFDEAERLFENRAALQHGGAIDRSSHDLVLAFNEELDGVHRHHGLNLIVIAATNHETALDPSIRSRFLVRETLTAPLAETLVKIFQTQLAHLQATEAISRFGALSFRAEAVERWAQRIEMHGLSGRDIKMIVTAALRDVGAAWVDAHPKAMRGRSLPSGKADAAWAEGAFVLERAVDSHIDSRLAAAEAEAAHAHTDEGVLPAGRYA